MIPSAEPSALEFVYMHLFERSRKGVLTDQEVKALEDTLLEDPEDGDVMSQTGGVRKSRVANAGRGKRGSGRVAYLSVQAQRTIYFLFAFPKNVQGNLTDEQKKTVRALVAEIRNERWPRKAL